MRGPVGNNLPNHTDDVIRTKNKLSAIDVYKAPIQNGYIDRELDEGIKRFQKKNDLKVDGRMNPGGETETTLISALFRLPKPKPRIDHLQKANFAAVLPPLAAQLARHLGMSAMAAWAWWQSQSTETRERTLRDMNKTGAIDTNPNTPEPDDKPHRVFCQAIDLPSSDFDAIMDDERLQKKIGHTVAKMLGLEFGKEPKMVLEG